MRKLKAVMLFLMLCALSLFAFAGCSSKQQYKITFNNFDGAEITSVTVDENSEVTYSGETPVRPADAEFTYTFAGWADESGTVLAGFPAATADATYTARYNAKKNSYTVKFLNGETELLSETKEYGSAVTYSLAAPEKAEDEGYTYTFNGWMDGTTAYGTEDTLPAVKGNVTYSAVFAETKKSFTVTWSVNGEETQTTVLYNDIASYGSVPEKAGNSQYTYVFAGWALTENGEVLEAKDMTVTGNVKYYAVFTTDANSYIIKFMDEEGALLDSRTVTYGSTVKFTGNDPVKSSDAQYSYVYSGWKDKDGTEYSKDENLPAVTGETTYTVVFQSVLNKYNVNWNIDGSVQTDEVEYGTVPAYDGTPEKQSTTEKSFEFIGWALTEDGEVCELTEVTGEITYYAVFEATDRKYTVTWHIDGQTTTEKLLANEVPEAEDPEKEATAKYTYTFEGWALTEDGEIITLSEQTITDDVDYWAVFSSVINKYSVKFLGEDGSILQETLTDYDAVPEFTGDATKPATAKYTYTLKGWTDGTTQYEGALPAVTGAVSYTAVYTATINSYTITVEYKYADGTTASETNSVTLEYGTLYNKDNSPVSPEIEGYLPDMYFFGGYIEENKNYTVTYGAADKWDGTAASASLSGTGTQQDPYLIQSAADLAFLSKDSNGKDNYGDGKYYSLTTNIDLAGHAWTPIGRSMSTDFTWKYFKGNFNGNGHTIGGLYYSGTARGAGLFNAVSGSVSNLILEGNLTVGDRVGAVAYMLSGTAENVTSFVNTVTTGANDIYQGGVVGATNNAAAKLINCVNYGTVTGATGNWVGGIVGSGEKATVNGCVNYGAVTSASGKRVGGVVGKGVTASIEDCKNYGTVTGGGAEGTGGIVGWHATTTVLNCVNYGTVTGTNLAIGGISGWLSAAQAIVRECTNYGEVSGTGTANKVGGIGGYSSGCIYDSVNYGNVSGPTRVAGILGDANVAVISGSTNYGNISVSEGVADTTVTYTGGIVGSATKPGDTSAKGTEITDCNNYGSVTGYKQVGGIAGYISGNSAYAVSALIENCKNYGDVTGVSQVGGVAGNVIYSKIIGCNNEGNVNATKDSAGIAGCIVGDSANTAYATIENSNNYGEVNGASQVGGIAGNIGFSKITGCTNEGKVTASSHSAGIAGETTTVIVKSCINRGDVVSDGSTAKSTALAGITGWTTTHSEIIECENYGDITAFTNVGGISGYLGGGDPCSTVTDSKNYGTITAEEHFGEIVGFNNGQIIDTSEQEA